MKWLDGLFRRNSSTAVARQVSNSVVVGGNSGLIYVMNSAGSIPAPPTIPWAELPHPGAPFEAFNLLSWRFRLSRELVGRLGELANLRNWAESGPNLHLRFLVGPGGAGKTRLAAELAETLRRESSWTAGFATLEQETPLPLSKQGLLIVLDYPEAAPAVVRSVLRQAARACEPAAPVRLLLLSRRPMSDWNDDIIQCGATALCDELAVDIGPLPIPEAIKLFQSVAERLAAHRGRTKPSIDLDAVAGWLRLYPKLHALPLLITAAAIHFIDEPTQTLGLEAKAIVTALVARERFRLDGAGKAQGWDAQAASRLVGLAALRNGLDADALRCLAAPPLGLGLPEPARIIDDVRALGWWIGERLPAPQPDIVAAELLRQVLTDAGDRAPDWTWAALSEPNAVLPEVIDRLMYDMATLFGPTERSLARHLITAVSGRSERGKAWRAIANSVTTSYRLAPVAVAVGGAILSDSALGDEERASVLNNLSVDLADFGDTTGALAAIQEAVDILRSLAQANPARVEPDLASSLTNVSAQLAESGDTTEALAAIQEAVDILRRLAQANPARFEPVLASSLNNLSIRLAESGDTTEALAAIREAVDIRRRLAQANPARFEPDLAQSLNNLSILLAGSGDTTEALAASDEAAEIRRRREA